jgi:type I restriction enzyme M protein
VLDQEVKRRINTARQILVGKVPDPKAQVEQITTALIYKFMDDMDQETEELGGKPQFFVEELKEFAWRRLMSPELSGHERWDLYTRALSTFSRSQRIPELFRAIFKDAYLPYRDPETLNLFLKVINEFAYDHSEELGNAYEYLLSILGSQGDAGQFRTPRHIIDFIVEVVDPKKENTILDPACGTAGFLISSYKHIWRQNSSNFNEENYFPTFSESSANDVSSVEVQKNGQYRGDNLTPDDRKRLARNIVGYDISPDMVRLSLVNMYLHGFVTPQIYEYDTLTYEDRWDDTFDIILANPPFMTPKGGIRPHRRFQVQAKRAEVLFVDYIAEHLTINGKAGIIVPEGIIFQSAKAYKELRKNLVENWGLYAVVSLPPGVFQPYSGVKTSILFLDRVLAKKTDEILFVKVENDGFDLGAQRRRIDKNDLPEAYKILKKWQKGEKIESKLALWVKMEKLAESGEYNLTGDRYREVIDYSKVKWPMVRLGDVCKIGRGFAFKSTDYVKEGILNFRVSNIGKDGKPDLSDSKYLPFEFKEKYSQYLLQEGDFVIVMVGATTGKIGLITRDILPALLNQNMWRFFPNEKKLEKNFFII